ncbi:TPM domain-containing protein [Planktothrix sp. FACHB-1355]|uniref:TPM domain-containing protein n=1 Tax=Aerosakkonema funiforme FACHB-1375 TaxID=2949571 RepID=A0A926ZIA8_9CYAN|nr:MULTISPECIES: TPM domain-containing protein [Oscillatoriales]MBD2183052.1 TPM domain-containing protein [Aerosakkonema funiforme FACHB-1375]MBD3557764.1 TPM domain-containing protein [Planktothrix sp. FACHB-1355]
MTQLSYQIYNWRKSLLGLILSVMLILAAIVLVAAPAFATSLYEMPTLTAGSNTWAIDKAEVLSRLTEGELSTSLEDLAKKTGYEVRMVTIRHLDYDVTIESFTNQLFDKWFPTPEAQTNQILLALDAVTNNTAIRIGDKVKSVMSDEIAQSIASETVGVPLRQGDKYNQALEDATVRLVAVLSGQPDPGPPQVTENVRAERTFKTAAETDKGSSTVWVIGLLIAATVIPMATYYWYQSMGS